MKKIFQGFLLLSFLGLTSCSSYFIRKECEKLNWFEQGKKAALAGAFPASDSTVQKCRKAEADIDEGALDRGFKAGRENYCSVGGAFETGKKGESFNYSLCDGTPRATLEPKHVEGVKAYCQPENGFELGRQGQIYTKICPIKLEKSFLPEYQKGRKLWLTAQLGILERRTEELTTESEKKRRSLELRKGDLRLTESRYSSWRAINPPTSSNFDQGQAQRFEDQISFIRSDVNSLQMATNAVEQELAQTRKTRNDYELELKTLP